MPTPRYLTSLHADRLLALSGSSTEPNQPDVGITLEEIESVEGDRYGFRGFFVRSRGFLSAEVGDRVYVQWQGGQPITILSVMTRRGGATEEPPSVELEGIEELFLFREQASADLFYRNRQQVTRLNLGSLLPLTIAPSDIGWSVDGEAFFVQCSETVVDPHPLHGGASKAVPLYLVFSLLPSQKAGPRGAQKVKARLVKTIHTTVTPLRFSRKAYSSGHVTIDSPAYFYGVEQPVLSEALKMYGVYVLPDVIGVVGTGGGSPPESFEATGAFSLITDTEGTILYEDPIIAEFEGNISTVIGTNQSLVADNSVELISWSDTRLSERRWFSAATKFWINDVEEETLLVASRYTGTMFEQSNPKMSIGSGAEFGDALQLDRRGFVPAILPTMCGGRYAVVDAPIYWNAAQEILVRKFDMVDLKTTQRTPIFEWTKAAGQGRYGYGPALRGLEMLDSGVLYAFPESPHTLGSVFEGRFPARSYYDGTGLPPGAFFPDEATQTKDRERFVEFTRQDSLIGNFLTAQFAEPAALKNQGKVSTKVPAGFEAVLASAEQPFGGPLLVMVRRRHGRPR